MKHYISGLWQPILYDIYELYLQFLVLHFKNRYKSQVTQILWREKKSNRRKIVKKFMRIYNQP